MSNSPVTSYDPNIYNDERLRTNIIPYLELTGWKKDKNSNDRWVIYWGEEDINGDPLEIVFPRNIEARNYKTYLNNAINLLTSIKDENTEQTLRKIAYYQSDVIYTRNLETGDFGSIALSTAADQVNELKRLVYFGTCSEKDAKPFFLHYHSTSAQKMVEHFRFDHTFRGSFGFTIESQILELPPKIEQLSFFDQKPPDPPMPIERRVMERIARGLAITDQAIKKFDTSPLIENYASGFNGNMCQAIVKMSQNKNVPIEYAIQWSPKIKPPDDISESKPIILSERGFEYLEFAADELKQLKPEYVTVKGRIIGLSAKDNPLGTDTVRTVIIRGRFQPEMRSADISIDLEKEDYLKARDAHFDWQTVTVSGILSRSGYAWRLSDYSDFTIS